MSSNELAKVLVEALAFTEQELDAEIERDSVHIDNEEDLDETVIEMISDDSEPTSPVQEQIGQIEPMNMNDAVPRGNASVPFSVSQMSMASRRGGPIQATAESRFMSSRALAQTLGLEVASPVLERRDSNTASDSKLSLSSSQTLSEALDDNLPTRQQQPPMSKAEATSKGTPPDKGLQSVDVSKRRPGKTLKVDVSSTPKGTDAQLAGSNAAPYMPSPAHSDMIMKDIYALLDSRPSSRASSISIPDQQISNTHADQIGNGLHGKLAPTAVKHVNYSGLDSSVQRKTDRAKELSKVHEQMKALKDYMTTRMHLHHRAKSSPRGILQDRASPRPRSSAQHIEEHKAPVSPTLSRVSIDTDELQHTADDAAVTVEAMEVKINSLKRKVKTLFVEAADNAASLKTVRVENQRLRQMLEQAKEDQARLIKEGQAQLDAAEARRKAGILTIKHRLRAKEIALKTALELRRQQAAELAKQKMLDESELTSLSKAQLIELLRKEMTRTGTLSMELETVHQAYEETLRLNRESDQKVTELHERLSRLEWTHTQRLVSATIEPSSKVATDTQEAHLVSATIHTSEARENKTETLRTKLEAALSAQRQVYDESMRTLAEKFQRQQEKVRTMAERQAEERERFRTTIAKLKHDESEVPAPTLVSPSVYQISAKTEATAEEKKKD